MKQKVILDTPICKIFQRSTGYHTYIKAEDQFWVEMAAYPNELKGLVNALDLAVNACSGKFFQAKGTVMFDLNVIEEEKKAIGHKE